MKELPEDMLQNILNYIATSTSSWKVNEILQLIDNLRNLKTKEISNENV